MTDEELKQIIDALDRLDWVQWVKALMQASEEEVEEEDEEEEAAATEATEQEAEEPENAELPEKEPGPRERYAAKRRKRRPKGGWPSEHISPEEAHRILRRAKRGKCSLSEAQRKMFGAAYGREAHQDDVDRERYHLLQQQVERQNTELESLRRMLDEERSTRINAERYSRLVELRQHYAFDLNKEIERCKCSRMSDQQFADHVQVIRENYRRIPIGERLPPLPPAEDPFAEPREKYTAEDGRKAREIVMAARERGQTITFEEALEQAVNAKNTKK